MPKVVIAGCLVNFYRVFLFGSFSDLCPMVCTQKPDLLRCSVVKWCVALIPSCLATLVNFNIYLPDGTISGNIANSWVLVAVITLNLKNCLAGFIWSNSSQFAPIWNCLMLETPGSITTENQQIWHAQWTTIYRFAKDKILSLPIFGLSKQIS